MGKTEQGKDKKAPDGSGAHREIVSCRRAVDTGNSQAARDYGHRDQKKGQGVRLAA